MNALENQWIDLDDGTPEAEADHLINNNSKDAPFEIHVDKETSKEIEERKVAFHPGFDPNRNDLRSFASQHRYFMQVGDQWIYGGDRYPHHEPESHALRHGYHIMCPVKWNNDEPTVYCEEKWEIRDYDGDGSSLPNFRQQQNYEAQQIKGIRKIMKSGKSILR